VRPFTIYPNWDFWFENIPSGNPGVRPPVINAKYSQSRLLLINHLLLKKSHLRRRKKEFEASRGFFAMSNPFVCNFGGLNFADDAESEPCDMRHNRK
jgi:hypothetical protein